MKEVSPRLDELVDSLCDFEPVDWWKAETSAANEHELRMVKALKVVATATEAHVTLHRPSPSSPSEHLPSLPLAAGTMWGHLEIIELLGRGASADVYRARDTKLDRDVALKLFHPWHVAKARGSQAIVEEGRLLARVTHPNVAIVYGADERDARVGLWMELVAGRTLAEIVQGRERFSVEEAATVGIKLCQALAAVHTAGLVHGDVKAQNVIRAEDGRIVLMDFSATRALAPSSPDVYAGLVGTPAYMAPELYNGADPSRATDVYALGILLFYLVAGELPEDPNEVSRPGSTRHPPVLRDRRPDVTEEFSAAVERATSSDPARRYETAGEMERALRSSRESSRERVGPKYALGIAAALLLIAVIGLGFLIGSRHRAERVRSLAVLPFANETGDEEMEYIGAGVAYGTVSRISQLNSVRVLSGSATETYRNRTAEPAEVARRLGVEAVLTGRIQRVENEVTLHAELVDARGAELWGERFVRSMAEVASLEEEFASTLAQQLGIRLSGEERARLGKRHTQNPRAYELYLRGRYFWNQRTESGFRRAIENFQRAIEADPGYAQAYAGLADAYALATSGYFRTTGDPPVHVALFRARNAAQTALELDGSLAEAHTSMGIVCAQNREWELAERYYREAIRLSPSYVTARQWYSRLLSTQGRHRPAVAEATRAVELDPVSPLQHRSLAFAHYNSRDYRSAIESFLRALELQPDYPFTRDALALSYWHSGHRDEAALEFEATNHWKGSFLRSLGEGRSEDALRILRTNEGDLPRFMIPVYHALARDFDTALDLLEELSSLSEPNVSFALRDEAFDPLLGEERFSRLVSLAGLPWRWSRR